MPDKIEKIGRNSWIQHGELNQRIYLMKLDQEEAVEVISLMNNLARSKKYSKIFCKVPGNKAPLFTANGFIPEAQIPGFFRGEDSMFFMSKFLSSDRLLHIETKELEELSKLLDRNKTQSWDPPEKSEKASVRKLNENDCETMAGLYKKVFQSYPFPIFDPAYILKTMKSGVQYFAIESNNKLLALASAEVDAYSQSAEMTDFATLQQHRGKSYAYFLLEAMQTHMKSEGIKTLYTIARLRSVGMNLTFLRMNYQFAGTLLKNTNISGEIESMNIYYKQL